MYVENTMDGEKINKEVLCWLNKERELFKTQKLQYLGEVMRGDSYGLVQLII